MATKTTKKTTKKTTEKVATSAESTSLKSVRIVIDVPSASMERLKILGHLVDETQSSMVTKAINDYVDDRKELIEQFIELRTKVTK